ncbi:MAG: ubiquinol-cytochrome C chaperone family protein [Proteobacteria bacterium]|nr:ubiquinol-cytochrome C chaperone family protein [Pseudomonadota bacterium]
MLRRIFKPSVDKSNARTLYGQAVAQARQPVFYTTLGVADLPDGRFEMVALHVHALLRHLRADLAARELAQALFDHMFFDMDVNLREMGVGDLAVGRRIKAMAERFYGRIAAYDRGLDDAGDALETALRRTVYDGAPPADERAPARLADYTRALDQVVGHWPAADLMAGRFIFPDPPPVEAIATGGTQP